MASPFLTVLSNVAILPAVAKAWVDGDFTATTIYACVFFASNAYHMCREGLLCATSFEQHQMLDYVFVYTSISWVMAKIAIKRFDNHIRLFVFYQALILCFVVARASEFLLPVIGIFVPAVVSVAISLSSGRKMFASNTWAAVTAACIAIAGIFMFFTPTDTYWWSHALWHLFSMSALLASEYATLRPS